MSEILRQELVQVSRYCHSRGWALATSGNFSVRSGDDSILITASGRDKGALTIEDFVEVNLEGAASGSLVPSAETRLHCGLYRWRPAIGAVLHTHSRNATVLSRAFAPSQILSLSGYEMLKALEGVRTHMHSEIIPIFPNQQKMDLLWQAVLTYLEAHEDCHAFLIESHGLYTWGNDIRSAVRHLEALEFLLECEVLATRRQP